jgi:hypothetical protein
MLFRALAFATFLASSAAADNDSFLRGDRLLQKGKSNTLSACATLGNGFPKGSADFKLNLLGKMKDNEYNPQSGNNIVIALSEQCKGKNGDMCSTSANTKILLYNSDTNTEVCTKDFEVVDPNGADGEAGLCFPDPFTDEDPCIDGEGITCATEALYAIYGRVRGKGSLGVRLCVTDPDGNDICPIGVVSIPQKRAVDLSQVLLTACIDADGDGVADDGVGLFDKIQGEEYGYFWDMDNTGVRNAELRFYYIQDLIAACGDMECEKCYAGVTRGDAC